MRNPRTLNDIAADAEVALTELIVVANDLAAERERVRAICEPLMTETVIETVIHGEVFLSVPAGMWHRWQRDMEAVLHPVKDTP